MPEHYQLILNSFLYDKKVKQNSRFVYLILEVCSIFKSDKKHMIIYIQKRNIEHKKDNGEPYVVTLSNLNRIVKADCPGKRVYIVENQNGFFANMRGLKWKGGCHLFYSGDLDPEGICIAD